ncbi:hypothetical protein OUY22_03010 [Nonomuraea sp. MCN248]|uniref:Uncharacterized protein n=1 Tax=Nonomuraea corallina TaxID=2989783 RepID=A0ABT4S595_9ACTN|nr:hypothetical protein [Nonomuraea corallina]MDA0632371.1 hypothetical protein [Nonomuraea corallina]
MRKAIQLVGLILALQGISGAIDHVAAQPIFGFLLNFFNRVIIPRVDALAGYELFANLSLAALGVVLILAAERAR